ncbi:MAG: RPA12/RPB9/RPC11 RNA polymerase family protein [Candidatus Woesearchaeota archaeon]
MFCPTCGSMLKATKQDGKNHLYCTCGYHAEGTHNVNIAVKEQSPEIEIVHKDEPSTKTIVDEECLKCGHTKAYHWTQQVGPSDEPEDNLFRCIKCGQGWRERY